MEAVGQEPYNTCGLRATEHKYAGGYVVTPVIFRSSQYSVLLTEFMTVPIHLL